MKKRVAMLSLALAACWGVAVYGDDLAAPWGTIHADLGGTGASNHPSLIFRADLWANGAEPAWTIDLAAAGIDRTGFRSSMTFDEAGNIYWKTIEAAGARVASVAPDGTIRWTSNDGAGNPHRLGASSAESVVVGDGGQSGRVYALGDMGSPNSGFVAAYSKATGAVQWVTPLPNSRFDNSALGTARLTPALYNGKLYVVGIYAFSPLQLPVVVFQVDTATGVLDWSANIPGTTNNFNAINANCQGQMTLIPDVFGPGKHGLYFNGDSASGADQKGEMYCIMVDTVASTASLAWASGGGKVARSHVIHMANGTRERVCTHTWHDYGGEMYCWDPDGTDMTVANNASNSGHGYYDIGSVDFNGTDIIAGGFEGQIVRYMNVDVNTNSEPGGTDVYYQMPDNWWGEPRMIGGLYQDQDGNSIFVSGTNSRGDCINRPPGTLGECLGETGFEARVFAVDVTNGNPAPPPCEDVDDGPIYIDNFQITGGPDEVTQSVILSVNGFESYALGDIPTNGTNPGGITPGGFSWQTGDHWISTNGQPQIVSVSGDIATTGVSIGTKVLKLDAYQGCYTDSMGVFASLASPIGPFTSGHNVVVVSWDQFRPDLWDNVFMSDHPDGFGWDSIQWDIQDGISVRESADLLPLIPGHWEHIEYRFDFAFSEVHLSVTNELASTTGFAFLDPFPDPPNQPEDSLRGFAISINGTAFTRAPIALTEPFFGYNTQSVQDHTYTVRGGPLVGPTVAPNTEQHIYYFRPSNSVFGLSSLLVALRPLTEFLDCNNNGVADAQDILSGTSEDCNGNNIPDECDIADGTLVDVTRPGGGGPNGVPDSCEDVVGPVVQGAVSWKAHGMAPGDSASIELDQQINLSGQPNDDAIFPVSGILLLSFETDGSDGWTRVLAQGANWYHGPRIDLNLAGVGPISVAGGGTLEFDARYFQDPVTNPSPNEDAPIFVRLYSSDEAGTITGYRDYGMVYQTSLGWACTPVAQYPNWQHISVDLGNLAGDPNCDGTPDVADFGDFDAARVTAIHFYGTDWSGTGDDFVDFKNLVLNTNAYSNRLQLNVANRSESRQGGLTEVVVTFNEPIFGMGGPSNDDVTTSSGSVTGVSISGNKLTVMLTGVADGQVVTLGFPGIADALNNVSASTLPIGVQLGDADGDMDVDLHDWALMQACFTGNSGPVIGESCASADFVVNGLIQIADHNAFAAELTGP